MNKKLIKKILIILIFIWIIGVFIFSNQPDTKSLETSGNVIEMILKKFTNYKDLSSAEQTRMVKHYQFLARKLAHFSIYTLGGILIYAWINTFYIKTRTKIGFSLILGALYASTDEFHQLFVSGRSGEFRDICIDSSGVLVGILISMCIIGIISKIHRHRLAKRKWN